MKAILSLIIILVLFILVEMIAEHFYKKTPRYKFSLGGAQNFYDVPNGIDICNVGSGPGLYAITYKDCYKKGFNFSTAPQNFKYGFRLLKNFKDKINENCIILIVIMCPLSFGNNADYKRKGYGDKFYGILPSTEIDDYSAKRALLLQHPLLLMLFSKLKGKLKRKNVEQVTIQNEPKLVEIWKKEFSLNDLYDASQADAHREAFADKIAVLSEGIDFCYSLKWRPVFVIPPVPEKTRSYIGEEFLQAFVFENIKVLQKKHKEITLLNYYADDRIESDMFKDDIFMNEKGSKIFSELLFNELKKEFPED